MNPLLQQFIQEARDFLQSIGEKLMELEKSPRSSELMTELFRLVHTLKGNSGLFEFPEMTRVLHAAEDLMDGVRDGRVGYSEALADQLLNAMDFVSLLIDEIEATGKTGAGHAPVAEELARSLRVLMPAETDSVSSAADSDSAPAITEEEGAPSLFDLPEAARMTAWREAALDTAVFLIAYRPEAGCFFKGEDPFFHARNIGGLLWGEVRARQPWPALAELDCYDCRLEFLLGVAASRTAIDEYFRYVPDQVTIREIDPLELIRPEGSTGGGPVSAGFVAELTGLLTAGNLVGLDRSAEALLTRASNDSWLASALRWLRLILETAPARGDILHGLIASLTTLETPRFDGRNPAAGTEDAAGPKTPVNLDADSLARLMGILAAQAEVLSFTRGRDGFEGRLKSVDATLSACLASLGLPGGHLRQAVAAALNSRSLEPVTEWLTAFRQWLMEWNGEQEAIEPIEPSSESIAETVVDAPPLADSVEPAPVKESRADSGEPKFGRRADDALPAKVLKVDQVKVDRLMSLIGEMVVAKNSLPYLANRAENQYGVRELSREIKAQYAVINRIAEEMQDAIMQVRMMPMSFIFQRFPRLVRDLSRKLGKDVDLVIEGEDTEADKNIVEALADPMIHIVRNSLDHGLESPETRAAAGKPRSGRLAIKARQESDRAVIEISDDGRGINPATIKAKAYEKGLIDEAQLDRLGDQEAINLIFAPGFSTAETITDLSGRGVGMDVVRSAIEKVGGAVELRSQFGKGTTLRLSLPLSMAVTNVMIIESDRQIFGVPMDLVVETVRLPAAEISLIKRQRTTVLRGRIVPLVSLNELLAVDAEPVPNGDDELATLVVRVGNEQVGLLVDDFREVVDVILKPMPGELAKLNCYAGTALLGDGSVLMVLNPKELF